MADIQITADYSDLQLIKRELVEVQGQARKSASVFEREFNKVERELKKDAKAAQDYYNSIMGVDRAHKSAQQSSRTLITALNEQERAERESIKAVQQKEAAVENLRLKYNPLYAAMVQYDNKLAELNMAQKEGAISAGIYEKELEKLNVEFNQFKSGTAGWSNQFVQGSQRAGKSMNSLGTATQQMGYQVGDFLVQVQSGTNWMVAFGQQATQLVGILPLLSSSLGVSAGTLIAVSAGLGIAIPLITALGAVWMRTSKDTDDASDSVKELDSQLKSLDSTLQDWINTKRAAEAGITVEELIGGQGLKDAQENLKTAREELEALNTALENGGAIAAYQGGILAISEAASSLWGGDEASQYLSAIEKVMDAENRLADLRRKQAEENFRNFAEERNDLLNQISLIEIAGQAGQESIQYVMEEARQRKETYGIQVDQMEITEAQALSLKRSYDIIVDSQTATEVFRDKMAGVANEAARLTTNMEGAAAAWAAFRSDQLLNSIGPGMTTGTGIDLLDIEAQGLGGFLPPAWGGDGTKGSTTGSSRRGGNRSRKEDTGISAFARSLLPSDDEQAQIEAWRTDALAKLAEFNAMELEMLGGQANAKALIQEEYLNRIEEMHRQERDLTLGGYESMFGSLATLFETGGEKMLGISRAFALAEATISIWRGAAKALELPYPANLGAWASVIATGAKAIQGIQSASKGSSNISGGKGGGTIATPAQGQPIAPQEVLITGLTPDSLLTGGMLQEIFDQIYEENKKRGTIFKVAL